MSNHEKEEAIKLVSEDGLNIDDLPPNLKNDPDIVLVALLENPTAVLYLDKSFKFNDYIVINLLLNDCKYPLKYKESTLTDFQIYLVDLFNELTIEDVEAYDDETLTTSVNYILQNKDNELLSTCKTFNDLVSLALSKKVKIEESLKLPEL